MKNLNLDQEIVLKQKMSHEERITLVIKLNLKLQ